MKKTSTWYQLVRAVLPAVYALVLFPGFLGRSFYMVLIFLAVSALMGAFFCGWLCPLGFVSEWLGKAGRLLKLPRLRLTRKSEKFLRFTRYLLIGLSAIGLGFALFLASPYSSFEAAARGITAYISIGAWILLGIFLVASLCIDRPFCRYFCVDGAQHGVLSMARLFSIRRNPKTCINCKACDRVCPTQVRISDKNHVRNGQCINCFLCIAVCPIKNTLTYGWVFRKKESQNESAT